MSFPLPVLPVFYPHRANNDEIFQGRSCKVLGSEQITLTECHCQHPTYEFCSASDISFLLSQTNRGLALEFGLCKTFGRYFLLIMVTFLTGAVRSTKAFVKTKTGVIHTSTLMALRILSLSQ